MFSLGFSAVFGHRQAHSECINSYIRKGLNNKKMTIIYTRIKKLSISEKMNGEVK